MKQARLLSGFFIFVPSSIMELVEVSNESHKKEFLKFPVRLYKEDKNWVRPLDKDINAVFDKSKNKLFRDGEAIRFLLIRDGNTIGRVAAFYNKKNANKEKQPTGGMGFFECIHDQQAANKLFDVCIDWLKSKGMEAMDGPINFGDRNNWWGLLVEGFLPPNYTCNYNFPYYEELFENYGFKTYFKQFTYQRPIMKPLSETVENKAARVFANKDYRFEHMKVKNWEKYAEDFASIYNSAWVKHGVPKLELRQAKAIFKSMKPVLDEEIVWFAYYKNEPIAFFIMLPELNQLFKYVNGKLDLIGKLKFLYHKKMGHCKTMFGVVFGVVPEQQGKGITGAIVKAVGIKVQTGTFRYKDIEMNWIGDFNPSMMRVAVEVGGEINKVHKTYRYLFDRNKEFERHPILN